MLKQVVVQGPTPRNPDNREGEVLDAEAFKAMILAAVAENQRFSARTSPDRGRK